MKLIIRLCILFVVAATSDFSAQCNIYPSITYSLGANGAVSFTGSASGATTNTSAWSWDFGDGSGSWGPQVIHSYSANTTFTAVFSVYSNSPNPVCTVTVGQSITITNYSCNLYPGFTVQPLGNGSYTFGCFSPYTSTWDFGDGTSGSGFSTSHTYSSAGSYNVCHTISGNCYTTTCQALNVTGIPCIANASFNAMPTNTAQVWNFIPAYPWNITSAVWNWGDNTTSNTLFTSHTYSDTGTYSVCLSVTAGCGNTNTFCTMQMIYKGEAANTPITIHVIPSAITGIKEYDLNQMINVYPNPANGPVYIIFPAGLNASFKLYNAAGQTVADFVKTIEPGKSIISAGLTAGLYFLEISSNGNRSMKKIMIQR